MKKVKLLVLSLLLTGMSYSQAKDTICYTFAGKMHIEFDYYTSTMINTVKSKTFKDKEILINKNEFLVVDLYDNCTCVKNKDFVKKREIIIYLRNGIVKSHEWDSGQKLLHFSGVEIKKIIVKKPKLK
tara:strand:+ start:260 stop:643 length:384 start_codon:yes stop_codon:yes gene_type:complete